MKQMKNNSNLLTQQEALNVLGLAYTYSNRQKLTYLRLGRKQFQLKRDGRSEYCYSWKPQIIENLDWFYQRSKVYYTLSGIEKLKDIFQNNKKIYIRENDF
jgi:hypothetical protein